VILRRFD